VDVVENYPHPEWIWIGVYEFESYSVNRSGHGYERGLCLLSCEEKSNGVLCLCKINIELGKVVRKGSPMHNSKIL
jgi:hypothetical protein